MKKIFYLLSSFVIGITQAQSPILSIPNEYMDAAIGSKYTLPQPDPTNWNSSTWHTPIYGLDDEAYDGRPAKSTSNTIFGPNGELAAFIVDEYDF